MLKLTYHQDRNDAGEHIRVDGHKCGHDFEGIARIYEPQSPNPMIQVERPLGMQAIQQIIHQLTKSQTPTLEGMLSAKPSRN